MRTGFEVPVCGMTWGWTGVRGSWTGSAAAASIETMAGCGVNWTAITYAAEQATAQSVVIDPDLAPTVTDREVRGAIRAAKHLGLKVCLKPVVNCADGTWRAYIGFFDWDVPGEPQWWQWFQSYREFIVRSAEIAESEGCEMLCIGCEMVRADGQEALWRELIIQVRAVYSGLITYNCDKYQEDRITWWDAVDVISASGYYPIDQWEEQLDRIGEVVAAQNKPFIFLEAGCPSRTGSAQRPNDWSLPGSANGAEQLRYYQVMFGATALRPWVRGFMLWDWPPTLYSFEEAENNDDYCIFGKPASDYVRSTYLRWQGVVEGDPVTQ